MLPKPWEALRIWSLPRPKRHPKPKRRLKQRSTSIISSLQPAQHPRPAFPAERPRDRQTDIARRAQPARARKSAHPDPRPRVRLWATATIMATAPPATYLTPPTRERKWYGYPQRAARSITQSPSAATWTTPDTYQRPKQSPKASPPVRNVITKTTKSTLTGNVIKLRDC